MRWFSLVLALGLLVSGVSPGDASDPLAASISLDEPVVGSQTLVVLSPTLLEWETVTTAPAKTSPVPPAVPAPDSLVVHVNGKPIQVTRVGFRRRVLYAPDKVRDLRIGNWLYLQLAEALPTGTRVEVSRGTEHVFSTADPNRYNPAVHVNQVGYAPQWAKHAVVGYYLGSLGELKVSTNTPFHVVRSSDGKIAFTGRLVPCLDTGWKGTETPYQHVMRADFTAFSTPGDYRLEVDGLGTSYPFTIADGIPAAVARTYALGVYHQRCGTALTLPFTRFVHGACHRAPASVPTMASTEVNQVLAHMTEDWKTASQATGDQIKNVALSLYPFVRHGPVDVTGGHHDAGDYSKYLIDSAQLVHHLIFAVDALPGVARLDNLGLPESQDQVGDLLEEAKWESDFILKMQDADGGFYFLVYPDKEQYEDKMPDHGDAQVVFPKTTLSTAAAVAALADMAASPHFKAAFPQSVPRYRKAAEAGWKFLQKAVANYGYYGAYQKINSYGTDFLHDDEMAWAAAALYTATGQVQYHQYLLTHFDPSSSKTWMWGWRHMAESYGCAIRDYAFAARTGKLSPSQLNPRFLTLCQQQIQQGGQDELHWTQESAYGLGLPLGTKRAMNPGWFFANDGPFDMVVAYQLKPDPAYLAAVVDNLSYELGNNPMNVSFLAGQGWHRPHCMVSQVAESDGLSLPPSGIPMACLQTEFAYLPPYGTELRTLSYPSDSDAARPYPLYDRYGDSWNVSTECTTNVQARCLASMAFLMARSPLATQAWKSAPATIVGGRRGGACLGQRLSLALSCPSLPLSRAQVVWESSLSPPFIGNRWDAIIKIPGPMWVQAEAQLADGRRAFAIRHFIVQTTNR